jgi:hypothetical protein
MKFAPRILPLVLAASCTATSPAVPEKGYSVSGRDPFRFEVAADLLREWGGYGSAKFNQVLEEELERLRICRNGYALRNDGTRERVFTATGRCKS